MISIFSIIVAKTVNILLMVMINHGIKTCFSDKKLVFVVALS